MKQKLEVIVHGKPTMDTLTESEKVAFYTTLYLRIQQLVNDDK